MKRTNKALAALAFSKDWKNRGDEKSDTQPFWMSLLSSVFDVVEPHKYIEFEKRVQLSHVSFIDAYIESTKVLIEQKSSDIDLHKGYKQSDGSMLTPFQQAKRYASEMPYSSRPRWVVVCNFQTFLVYDMEHPNGEPFEIQLENLAKEYYRLSFLTNTGTPHLKREMEISIKAGDLIGKIYDALLVQYKDATNEQTLKSLNVLCVRLVFCLYAEDAGIFGTRCMFHDYLSRFDARDIRRALIDLFKVLDTRLEERDPYLDDELAAFPYVNGGLFTNTNIEIPQFTEELRTLILDKTSDDFNWSEISPTIFGAVFESTLNPETRRSGGMHYTSIENIHKVIDPLFLNDLQNELNEIKNERASKAQEKKANEFQDKLASLKFLDPACGSGNFLTETYLSLRRLENEAIRIQTKGQSRLGFEETNPIKVNIQQFYGIEINDFAVATATTALWIAENQMLKETESIVDLDLDMLPLKTYTNIKEGNALQHSWTEWNVVKDKNIVIANTTNLYPSSEAPINYASDSVATYNEIDLYSDNINIKPSHQKPKTYHVDFNYIMGNPPFVGGMMMTRNQKQDMLDVFGNSWRGLGELDYVGAWYYKATQIMAICPNTRTAFVSTNSITQGEQVAILWKQLHKNFNVHIDFAYRTFRWDSEANLKARVHCVIVGFSCCHSENEKFIFTESCIPTPSKNINPYLYDAPNVWITNRSTPMCDVPNMNMGNMPRDGGGFILSEEEKIELSKNEPLAKKWIHEFIGAAEFLHDKKRYCLWLQDANPNEIRSCPTVMKRIESVKNMRLKSKAASTRKLADTPTLFAQITQPLGIDFIVIPKVSSEKRKYMPLGFMNSETISSDLVFIIPNATIYHFGILTSSVHMAWMRVVCGRLKSDYRYSKDIVYNNFPWCHPTEKQKQKIELTAQAILDTRTKYPNSSLADLYDETTMPPDLRLAHQKNDRAVMAAYDFNIKMTEIECVAELFKLYEKLID